MNEKKLRYGECLLHLPPIMRACASCEKLYECAHGEKVCFGDMSITEKVLKLDWMINDSSQLKKLTLVAKEQWYGSISMFRWMRRRERLPMTVVFGRLCQLSNTLLIGEQK